MMMSWLQIFAANMNNFLFVPLTHTIDFQWHLVSSLFALMITHVKLFIYTVIYTCARIINAVLRLQTKYIYSHIHITPHKELRRSCSLTNKFSFVCREKFRCCHTFRIQYWYIYTCKSTYYICECSMKEKWLLNMVFMKIFLIFIGDALCISRQLTPHSFSNTNGYIYIYIRW